MKHRFLLAASLALASFTASSALAETKLLLSTFFPNTHPFYTDVLEPWAAAVKSESNGALTIEFAPSSLAPPAEQLSMVENGVADLAVQFTGVVPKRLTALTLTEIPGPASTAENMSIALQRTQDQFFAKSDAFRRLKLLSVFTFTPQALYGTTDKQIESVDEMKGAKIATTPGTAATTYGAVTGGVVAGPAFRYFELVSKGMVDFYAAVTPTEVLGFNLERYTKTMTRMGDLQTAGSFALVMNERKWRALSPDEQAAFEKTSGEAFGHLTAALDKAADAAVEHMTAAGVQIRDIPPALQEQLGAAFGFVQDEWIKAVEGQGIDAKGALDFYRATLAELEGQQ